MSLILLASILLFRTVRMMLVEEAFEILVAWVIGLLILEFLIDLGCVLSSIRWATTGKKIHARLPLRLGALTTILHAVRVLIYILGRTGPWVNFDVKPEYHESYVFEWFWVYYAGILSISGIIVVIVIWSIMRKKSKDTSVRSRE